MTRLKMNSLKVNSLAAKTSKTGLLSAARSSLQIENDID